jgi:hypothetical protein
VEHAIDVQDAADFAAGMRFAHTHNVRPVVKNTGHEYIRLSLITQGLTHASYLGKLTGKGAFSL